MANRDGENTGILMVMYTKANGRMILRMEKELCTILTKINTKVSGERERKMGGVNIGIIMALCMKAILLMAEKMDLERLAFPTEQEYKLIGSKHMSKDKVRYTIQMVIIIKDNIICLKNMEKVFIFGVHKVLKVHQQNMKDNLKKTHFKVKQEFILQTDNIIVVGLGTVKEMDKEHTFTKMETLLKVNGKTILNLLETINLKMATNLKANLNKTN